VKVMLSYLKNYKKEVIFGPIFKLLEAILEVLIPFLMIQIIDVGIVGNDANYIIQYGFYMVALGIAGYLLSLVCQYFASKASQGYGTVIRNALFKHISKLSQYQINNFGTNSLITRMNNDINAVQVMVAMTIRLGTRVPFIVIGSTIMAFIIDVRMAVIFLVSIPFIALILYLVMSKVIPLYTVVQKKLDKLSLLTRENLTGIRVIRAFAKQEEAVEKFDNAADDIKQMSIRVGNISALLNPAMYLVVNIAIIVILWFGGNDVDSGRLSQGQIIALINYMIQIQLALVVFANLIILETRGYASMLRIGEVLTCEPDIVEVEKPKEIQQEKSPILQFDNVSFTYSGAKVPVLSNISFTLKKGETLGIIGGTGSGKSSLINLVPRFFDVTIGKILINGINIKEISFKNLRKRVSIVAQKAVVFSGTIAENLRWGNINATDAELERALRIAQAQTFVAELPVGLDTKILQDGKNLSGGQRQRLSIARSIVANPDILIFDDSSSALDYATDAALRLAIKEHLKDTTVITVSQRINAIRYADKIMVLDEGNVVAIGTHKTLLKTCDIYKEIALTQLTNAEIEGDV
jgi:ABC-type multidrug transport system, ATPase and permease components